MENKKFTTRIEGKATERLIFMSPWGVPGVPPSGPAAAPPTGGALPTLPEKIDPPKNLQADETRKQLDALDKDPGFNELVYKMANIHKVDFYKWYNEGNYQKAQEEFFKYFDQELPGHQQRPFFEKVFNTLNSSLPKDNQEYKDAKAAFDAFMKGIIEVKLQQLVDMKKVEEEKLNEVDGGPLDKIKEAGNNLLMAWNEGDGMDKGMLLAFGFITFKVAQKLWDKKLPGLDMTVGDALTYAGGAWAVNVIVQKATGKSLLEHAGVADPRKDLKQTEYAKMAYHLKIDSPDMQKTMLELGQSDVRMPTLLALYERQSQADLGKGFIDPIAAGLNIPPGDKDIYDKKGKEIFAIMRKMQEKVGGYDLLQKRYGDDKDRWTFAGAVWNEYNLESFKQRAGLMDRVMDKAYGVLGYRRHESVDVHKFLDKFRLPDTYPWKYEIADDNGTPVDGKFDMELNDIPVTVEHVMVRGADEQEGVAITIKSTGKKHEFKISKDGNLQLDDLKTFEGLMKGELQRRLTNVNLTAGAGTKIEAKDIVWDKDTQSWIAAEVTIPPSVDDPAPIKGKARIVPIGDNDVRILLEGTGLSLDIFNELRNAPPDALRFMARVSNSPEFRPVFEGIAPYVRVVEKSGDKAKVQVGGAILAMQYRAKPGSTDKAWLTDPAAGPDALKNFVTHNDYIQAKVESVGREGSPLVDAIKQLKGNFDAGAESYWKNMAKGMAKYMEELWHDLGRNLPAPTAEIISGSIPQNYAMARLDAVQKEIIALYALTLGNLKNKGSVSGTDVQDAYNSFIILSAEKLKQVDMKMKVMNEAKTLDKGEWSTEEIMDQLDMSSVVAYKNTSYNIEMDRFRDEVYTLDYQGLDKSDWAARAHQVREKLVGVYFHYTRDFAIDTEMDDIDYPKYEADIQAAEAILRRLAGTPAHPNFIKAKNDRDIAKAKYDKAKENMQKKFYLAYVRTQIFNKTLEFSKGSVDNTVREISLRPGGHPDWNVMPFNQWKGYGPMLPEQLYMTMPKLGQAQILRLMRSHVENEFQAASRLNKYDQNKLDTIKAKWMDPIELTKVSAKVAKFDTRLKQERFLIAYQSELKESFQSEQNVDTSITGEAWYARAWDWTTDKAKMLWPGNW